MLLGAVDRLVAHLARLGVGVGADARGLLLGGALDRRRGALGRLDDHADLLRGGHGEGLDPGRADGSRSARGALGVGELPLQALDLEGQRIEVGVHRFGLVATAADGEVLLLDGLPVESQSAHSSCGTWARPRGAASASA